jgi:hypothetical protein
VPRKIKTQGAEPVTSNNGTPPQPSAVPSEEVQKVAKKSRSRKTAAKKSASTSRKKAAPAKQRRHPTDEQIRIRAYFIAERRVQSGLPGTEHDDWLAARRELEAELNA